jgi:hypothetical protein
VKAFLYKFELKDGVNAILFISDETDESLLRLECIDQDPGGVNFEDFERIWETGKCSQIKSLNDVPVEWRNSLPYVSTKLEQIEITVAEFCAKMDKNYSIEI